jgi:hypothetical protein
MARSDTLITKTPFGKGTPSFWIQGAYRSVLRSVGVCLDLAHIGRPADRPICSATCRQSGQYLMLVPCNGTLTRAAHLMVSVGTCIVMHASCGRCVN